MKIFIKLAVILGVLLITSCYYKSETHDIILSNGVNIFSPPQNTYSAVFKIKGSFNCETHLQVGVDQFEKIYYDFKLLGKKDTSISVDWYSNDMHIIMEPNNCVDDLEYCFVKFIY